MISPAARTGRPPQRAPHDAEWVAMSFRARPALKNLLLDLSQANDVSMVEQLELLVLREAGLSSLEEYEG